MVKKLILAMALLGMLTPFAFGQGAGQIVGSVKDPSQGSIPNVTVTVTEAGTGQARTMVTGSDGAFTFPNLRPTSYIITATGAGFRAFRQTDVDLLANQSLTVNIPMEVGAVTETVTVAGQTVQVDTSTSTLAEVVESARIIELPLNGRDAAKLSTLIAGTVMISTSTETGKGIPGNFYLSANGSGVGQVSYRLDGNSNTDTYFQLNQEFPFPDALQEFSIQTSGFSAAYGNSAGAVVNAITKSGTNDLHGGAFEFVRNRYFNAKDFFAKDVDFLKRNQFGSYAGGPVYIPKLYNGKNRTFFFMGWQATRYRDVNNARNANGPTADELNGDFSKCGALCSKPIIDPTTISASNPKGTPYPGNQIPTKTFDPVAVAFAKQMMPAGLTGDGLYTFQTPISRNYAQGVIRGDHQIGQNDRLMLRYFIDNFTNAPTYDPHNYVTFSNGSETRIHNANIGEIHTFSPTVLNDWHFGYTRQFSQRGPAAGVPTFQSLGMTVNQGIPEAPFIEGMNVSGFFSAGDNTIAGFTRNGFEMSDRVSWVKGSHSMSFGFSIDKQRADIRNLFLRPGTVTFSGNITGMAMADFFLGDIGTWIQGSGEYKYFRATYPALYAQDDWKVTSRLTLNLGLRWEPTGPWIDVRDRYEKFRVGDFYANVHSKRFPLGPPGTTFYGDPGVPYGGTAASWINLAPRIGFAWDVFGNGKTSVRGGSGFFYDQHARGDTNNNGVDAAPWSPQTQINNQGQLRAPYITSGLVDGFPYAPASATSVFPVHTVETTYRDETLPTPLVYNWNITLEHQLPSDFLVRGSYVGSRGIHERRVLEYNSAVNLGGIGTSASPTSTTDQRRLFWPYYSSGLFGYGNNGVARYNSLQMSLLKRYSHGFTFQMNYTWSKSIDDIGTGITGKDGGGDQVLPWYSPFYDQVLKGPSDFDHTHRFVTSYVWDIPFGNHMKGLAKGVLGGWQLTGIQQYQTGSPMTVTSGVDNSRSGLNRDRADYVVGQSLDRPAGVDPLLQWFNKTAFVPNGCPPGAIPACPFLGTFGNVGKGTLRGPSMAAWDMGAFKKIPLKGDRAFMQFRAEFFNIFNHPMFNNPSTILNNANYGRITQTLANAGSTQGDITSGGPRIIQLALKLTF